MVDSPSGAASESFTVERQLRTVSPQPPPACLTERGRRPLGLGLGAAFCATGGEGGRGVHIKLVYESLEGCGGRTRAGQLPTPNADDAWSFWFSTPHRVDNPGAWGRGSRGATESRPQASRYSYQPGGQFKPGFFDSRRSIQHYCTLVVYTQHAEPHCIYIGCSLWSLCAQSERPCPAATKCLEHINLVVLGAQHTG